MRRTLILLAPLALIGCQLQPYDLVASMRGSDVVITAENTGYFGRTAEEPTDATAVVVWGEEGVVWRINADYSVSGCQERDGGYSPFPLTYGRVPECFREIVPAADLQRGTPYAVLSEDSTWHGEGAFRLDGGEVDNLDYAETTIGLPPTPDLDECPEQTAETQDNSSAAAMPEAPDNSATAK